MQTTLKSFAGTGKPPKNGTTPSSLYLKDRLKLEISPEKSQIVNLRKRESEFLGFTIRANKKGNKRVAHTGIKANKKRKIKDEAKKRIQKLRASPTAQNAILFNSFVLGIHNYFNRATHVNVEFSRLAYDLRAFMYNRLKQIGKYEHPANPPPTYRKFYSLGFRTFKVANVYLFPLANVKTVNTMNFSQELTPLHSGRQRTNPQKASPRYSTGNCFSDEIQHPEPKCRIYG